MKKCKLLKIVLIIAFILANFLSFSPATISAGDDPFVKIIAGIGANETTLTISNEQNITADITVPSNVTLMFLQGGSLNISAGKTVTINGHVDAGLYQIFKGVGNVQINNSFGIKVNWHGDINTDIGIVINKILTGAGVRGCKIIIPWGTYTCATTINLDLVSAGSLTIEGAGWHVYHDVYSDAGTVIDGSGMATDVIKSGDGVYISSVFLRDFTVYGGTGSCVVIGDTTAPDGANRSELRNISTLGGEWGFRLFSGYGSVYDHLHSRKATVGGFYLWGMNACKIGQLTARETQGGSWAVDIIGGAGWNIDQLYIESNYGGALRLSGSIYSSGINTLYSENNNVGDASDYEMIFGDSAVSASKMYNVSVSRMSLNAPANVYALNGILIEKVGLLSIGVDISTAEANWTANSFFKAKMDSQSQLEFINSTGTIDFTDMGAFCSILFTNYRGTASFITVNRDDNYPMFTFSGYHRFANDNLISLASVHTAVAITLHDFERTCTVDATGGAISIKLPYEGYGSSGSHTIQKVDASGNAVTVIPNQKSIQGGNIILTAQGNTTEVFFDTTNDKWYKKY